jgi:glutathione S-transferase
MINCYAFGMVPPFAQGLVRDLRVRWALEEAGLPYHVTLVGDRPGEMPREAYNALQPFGQIPLLEDGDVRLFESGAIVHYVAERSRVLLPAGQPERAHVMQWMFAALNTIEPAVMRLAMLDLFYGDQEWAKEERPTAVDFVRQRLAQLANTMKGGQYLTGTFSAADILMSHVLKILRHTDLLQEQPTLAAYRERCEARPAHQKALAGQMESFAA